MNTKRTLYEIEVALSKTDKFNYIKNIVEFMAKNMYQNSIIENCFLKNSYSWQDLVQ